MSPDQLPMLWRGSVHAQGYWIDPALPTARARVLERWSPGARLFALEGRWLLVLAAPERAPATPPGLVLVERGGALLGASNATGAPGDVVLPVDGGWRTTTLRTLTLVDPSSWFDIETVSVDTAPLGPPPAPAPVIAAFNARAALGRPPPSKESVALLASLKARPAPPTPPALSPGASLVTKVAGWFGVGPAARAPAPAPAAKAAPVAPPAASSDVAASAPSSGWFSRLAGWFGGGGRASATAVGGPRVVRPVGATGVQLPAKIEPSRSTLRQFFENLLAPLWTPVVEASQNKMMDDLMTMFDEGRLDEALRWAIPLGDGTGESLGPSTSIPTARRELTLHPGSGPSTTINAAPSYFDQLRAQYQRALDKFIAEGRIDEAVFVLVELLREKEKAVDLLEKHGRFELAAEIAEAAGMPPERIIRLQVRGGRIDSAILTARRTGAFQAALNEVQKHDKALAIKLRWAWAEHLAERGDMAGACTVAWLEPELRPGAVQWLDGAIGTNTPAGARLLGHMLRQTDATFAMVRPRVEALLTGEGVERIRMRRALVEGLIEAGAHGRLLARPVLRRLLADREAAPTVIPDGWLRESLQRVDEPAFVADLPVLGATTLAQMGAPTLEYGAGDAGLAPVLDLMLLPDGGVLIALGELGSVLYGRRGQVRARFDEPVHALVPVQGTSRVIGVAKRAWGVRLCRIDCGPEPAAVPWHDGRYTCWERETDGSLWFVGEGADVIALDVLAPGARPLWRMKTTPAGGKPGTDDGGGPGAADGRGLRVTSIARNDAQVVVLTVQQNPGGRSRERWALRRSDLKVLGRDPVSNPTPGEWVNGAADLITASGPKAEIGGRVGVGAAGAGGAGVAGVGLGTAAVGVGAAGVGAAGAGGLGAAAGGVGFGGGGVGVGGGAGGGGIGAVAAEGGVGLGAGAGGATGGLGLGAAVGDGASGGAALVITYHRYPRGGTGEMGTLRVPGWIGPSGGGAGAQAGVGGTEGSGALAGRVGGVDPGGAGGAGGAGQGAGQGAGVGGNGWDVTAIAVETPQIACVILGPTEVAVLLSAGTVTMAGTARPLLNVRLQGATGACVRLTRETLAIGDDRGRVLVIDVNGGKVLRDLRVG